MFRFTFDAIGTAWEIETPSPLEMPARRRILDRIEQFDATYSRFRSDSLVSRIASSPEGGCFTFPEDSITLFDLYDRLHACTEGAVDPLVGRDLELLGYDRTYSLTPDTAGTPQPFPARPRWSKDVRREGASLVTRCPLVIDVGAAGKGIPRRHRRRHPARGRIHELPRRRQRRPAPCRHEPSSDRAGASLRRRARHRRGASEGSRPVRLGREPTCVG